MGYVVRPDVMDMQVPERSVAQRMEALRRANVVRLTRAEWKRAVKRDLSVVLLPLEMAQSEGWSPFDTMKIGEFLWSIPKVGKVKALDALRRAAVSPAKTLAGLTTRQRAEVLVFALRYARRGSIDR